MALLLQNDRKAMATQITTVYNQDKEKSISESIAQKQKITPGATPAS